MDQKDVESQEFQDAPEQIRVRAEKRARLIEQGTDPYPVELPITSTIEQVREKYEHLEIDESLRKRSDLPAA